MSLTARERGNPPPRRKSCAACIKAKRRCDFVFPACMRCTQRMIPCEYPSQQHAQGRRGRLNAQQQPLPKECVSPRVLVIDEAVDADEPAMQFEMGLDTMGLASSCASSSFPGLSFLDVMPETDFSMELISRESSTLAPPSSPEFPTVEETVATRLQYAIDQIKLAPSVMTHEFSTPWCHPELWKNDLPRPIEDVFAACSMYMIKNRANAAVVLRLIDSRASDLASSSTPLTARENLAHTQALLLYQIMLIFDGDISARASAERSMSSLETSAVGLLSFADFETDVTSPSQLSLYPLASTRAFWNDWIFQESLRRTLLFTFYFIQIYRLLAGHKGLRCDGRLGLIHSWTLSAHLWYARTPVEFAEAWKEKNHFVVTNAQFAAVLQEAQAHDIDAFGRIFISSLMGIEEAEGWFAARGGSLKQVRVDN